MSHSKAQKILLPIEPPSVDHGYLDSGERFEIYEDPDRRQPVPDAVLMARFPERAPGADNPLPFFGHRVLEHVTLSPHNRELAGEIHKGGYCSISLNAQTVAGFQFTDTVEAIEEAARILKWLRNWRVVTDWSARGIREALINRDIWYREQPGRIVEFHGGSGTVLVVPVDVDNETGAQMFKAPPWAAIRNPGTDMETALTMNAYLAPVSVALWSPEIYWWRTA